MADLRFTEQLRLHNGADAQTAQSLQGANDFQQYMQIANKHQMLYNQMAPTQAYEELDPAYRQNGFGSSRFDKRARYLEDIADPTDLRAREQSFLGRLGNDIVKTVVTTGTTAANLINLLTYGIGNGIAQGIKKQDNNESNNAFLNGLIDNPFTNLMNDIEDYFEKVMPNYRSHEEQDTTWYKRAFTPGMSANFWFDDVMKNVGFSIGSMAAAKGVTTLVGKGLRLAERKAYREAFETLGKTLMQPNTGKQATQLLDEIAQAGVLPTAKRAALNKLKQLSNRDNLITELSGTVLGAVGEAQFEANNALHDFKEKNNQLLDNWMQNNEHYLQQMYTKANGLDDQEKPISFEQFKENKRAEAQSEIDAQANRVANSVFGWETGLLTLTNYSTFRRFFSGGFRNFNSAAVKAGLEGGGDEIIDNIGKRMLKNGTVEAFNKLTRAKKIANVVKPLITEGPVEEMGQNFINKSSEFYHGSYLNEQLGYLLNPEYNNQAVDFINAVGKGLTRSYGNVDEWLDGFAGSIMGAFGLPHIHYNKKSTRENNSAKKRFDISLDSGMYGEWKKIHNTDKLINEAVTAVNAYLQSPEKIKEFQHAIAQIALDDKMSQAGLINDPLQFKDSEHISLMKTIAAFKNAGMENMLDEYIENASKDLTDEHIATIRQGLNDNDAQSLSDEQIRQRVQHEAEDMKELVKSYREINNNLMRSYSYDMTNSQIDLLSEMLALADYKMQRVVKIVKENKYLFPDLNLFERDGQTVNMSKAIEALTNILQLNDEAFDILQSQTLQNKKLLTQEQINKVANRHTQKVLDSFPQAWNQSKKEEVYRNLVDAYVNLKDGVALNNEFASLINNPTLMHTLAKQLFDDHLSDADKQMIQSVVTELINSADEETLRQKLNDITNVDVKDKIVQQLKRDGNQLVKDYFQKELEKEAWQQTLQTYKYTIANFVSDENERQTLEQILSQLENEDVETGVNTIFQLLNDPNLTDAQRNLILELWDVWKTSIPGKTIIKLEQQTQIALTDLLKPQGAFVSTLLPIVQKRNSQIQLTKIGFGLKVHQVRDMALFVVSDLQAHKLILRFAFQHGSEISMCDYILDAGTAISNTNQITLTAEEIQELVTTVHNQLQTEQLATGTVLNLVNEFNTYLINNPTLDTPITQQDIDLTIQNEQAKQLWNQYLNPETITIQEQAPAVTQTNNNTPNQTNVPAPVAPVSTTIPNSAVPAQFKGIESTRLQQIKAWLQNVKIDFDLVTQAFMNDPTDDNKDVYNHARPLLEQWAKTLSTPDDVQTAKEKAYRTLFSLQQNQTFYNQLYTYVVQVLTERKREIRQNPPTQNTNVKQPAPATTYNRAITFPSETLWDNYRTEEQKHKPLPKTDHLKTDLDRAIWARLNHRGAFTYLNSGGLFKDGYLNYKDANLKSVIFKQNPMKFGNTIEPIIDIYAGTQLIGVLTSEHTMYQKILKTGFDPNTKLYNCTTTLTRFQSGTLLYHTDSQTEPLKDLLDAENITDYCDEIPMLFVDKKLQIHTSKALNYLSDLKSQLKRDVTKFTPGTVYIINQTGDNFTVEPVLSHVQYVPFGISPMGWNEIMQLPNSSKCKTQLLQIVNQISQLTTTTNVDERQQLIRNVNELLIRNVRTDDPIFSEFAYTFNLVYNTNDNSAALKWESDGGCVDKLELHIFGGHNSLATAEECAKENLQNILNFLSKNDPILSITDATFTKRSFISFNDMVNDGILASALYQYLPVNTTCYLNETDLQIGKPAIPAQPASNVVSTVPRPQPQPQSISNTNTIMEARQRLIDIFNVNTFEDVLKLELVKLGDKIIYIKDFTNFSSMQRYLLRQTKFTNEQIAELRTSFDVAIKDSNNAVDATDIEKSNNCTK